MIACVLTLFMTLFDIVRLRKGPEAIPYSPALFGLVLAAWLIVSAFLTRLISEPGQADFAATLLLSAIALGLYAGVVVVSQQSSRVLQTLTAILGCGVVLELIFIAGHVLLTPLLGRDLAALVNFLVLLWSVPVEGHIIARAINQKWYIGLLIAISVFLIQIEVSSIIGPGDLAAS